MGGAGEGQDAGWPGARRPIVLDPKLYPLPPPPPPPAAPRVGSCVPNVVLVLCEFSQKGPLYIGGLGCGWLMFCKLENLQRPPPRFRRPCVCVGGVSVCLGCPSFGVGGLGQSSALDR